ncbi:FAD-dependent oxidoreductase [Sulfurimonas sp.]|jgi:glycine/D-amino acid oxidase-like deaminating enzyme|uniref:FAD-dependent oxidoreductase n=1 Tax=Sulfurimonas sp. TaxID=2022749 RepID=UPI0025D1B580|nr:FAD-dependent oxidoreductase [Sulfurimonas sp.]MCK9473404.1 FAD-dependent oxidoreductase [Sulfurimonas sp.]MDD3505674.1 FAD-dependent oxidoreductase [Sulfurimonas sp.]
MKIYDFLIIGAGSAGCNMAYFLHKENKSVAIVDREGIAGGASGAAGAFLSPLPGKENPYNSLVNEALKYSLNFYQNLLPIAVDKKGVLRVANENFDKDKLSQNSMKCEHINSEELLNISKNFMDIEGYFYENAAVIEPIQICHELTKGCDFYNLDAAELYFENGIYTLEGIRAKNIILAQGVSSSLVKIPYMQISPIFGLRVDVKTTTKVPFNIHKSISISTNKHDGTLSIGATQERHDSSKMECLTTCDKCTFYVNNDEMKIETLLKQADALIKLEDLEVVKIYKGARATIKSYFPLVGKVVDYEQTLKKYSSIKNGTKIPSENLEYYPNLYVINALGSRGFVFGPYLAKILTQNIIHNEQIPKEISTQKLFYKMARKN